MAYVWMKLEREVGELSIRVLQILSFPRIGKTERLSREYTLAVIDKSILRFFTSKVNSQN